jgi:hypothetical protein
MTITDYTSFYDDNDEERGQTENNKFVHIHYMV